MKRLPVGRFLFILPALVAFAFFIVYPIAFNIFISFTSWHGYGNQFDFVGWTNYVLFSQSLEIGYDIANALFWSAFFLTVPVVVGLFLAALLTTDIKGKWFFKAVFYYPQVLSGLLAALIWTWMITSFTGLIPDVLSYLNAEWVGNYIFSFNTEWTANATMAVISLWQSVGFSMIIFLVGLSSISPSLVESARTEGAGRLALYWNVIVPLLRPFLVVIIVFAIANALRYFDLVYGLTQGGPAGSTQTLGLTMWIDAFIDNYYGQGAAVANLLFVLTAIITVVYLRFYLRSERSIWTK